MRSSRIGEITSAFMALSILKDEVIRVEARQTPPPTVLAAPAAPISSASTTHNPPTDQSFSNRGRGRGRHQHFRGRGGRGRGSAPPSLKFTYSRRPRPQTPSAPDPPPCQTQPVPSSNTHPMTTRSKSNNSSTTALHISSISPLPSSYAKALADPHWSHAMQAEFAALQDNATWELVPRPTNQPVIRCM
ncbi:hypothetical protein E3N88_25067 [Mikania micrantha]|uniref:Reverse transcriptase Ty1/copia-type domain-containing protein n=1 Tax=Mikania micrantha TaxID=192012 RepID=A0A5N6N3P2_9ASTR|nr:hypothetical protein E3N88_25067 [Mikania micrantha]